MKRLLVFLCVLSFLALVPGCHWMGKTAGKAQTAIEGGIEDTKKGYEEGHKKEESQPSKKEESQPVKQEEPAQQKEDASSSVRTI